MNEIIVTIFLGVFSGVITYLVILLISNVLKKIIIPWYQGKVYLGLDINGEWVEEHTLENLIKQVSKIYIKQNAHGIKGHIVLSKSGINNNKVLDLKKFRFSGEFYNNHLNISCWNENKKQVGTHNYLLKVNSDGRGFEGFKTYFDIGYERITSEKVYWNRKTEN